MPEKSTPSGSPVEGLFPPKTVCANEAEERSEFWNDTLARFTPVKSMPPLMFWRTALVPERLTPVTPSENIVVLSNTAADRSIPDKSWVDISCPR